MENHLMLWLACSLLLLTVLQFPNKMITLFNDDIPGHADKVLGSVGTHRLHSEDEVVFHLVQGHALLQVIISVHIPTATINPRIGIIISIILDNHQ